MVHKSYKEHSPPLSKSDRCNVENLNKKCTKLNRKLEILQRNKMVLVLLRPWAVLGLDIFALNCFVYVILQISMLEICDRDEWESNTENRAEIWNLSSKLATDCLRHFCLIYFHIIKIE